MPDITIPDAAVEAAAAAHRTAHTTRTDAWEPLPDNIKAMWREEVLDALAAAAPHIAAQALRDAADEWESLVQLEVPPVRGSVWLSRRADRIEADQ